MHERRQARCSEGVEVLHLLEVAKAERLIAQAMALLQQKQALVLEQLRRCQRLGWDWLARRHGQHEDPVDPQAGRGEAGVGGGEAALLVLTADEGADHG